MHFVPGGPVERQIMAYKMAMARGKAAPVAARSRLRHRDSSRGARGDPALLRLRQAGPHPLRAWLWNVVHLDLGTSYIYQDPVWDVIKSRFPVSIFLGLTGFLLSYLVCIPLGVIKAVRHGSRFDFVSSALVFLGYSVPGWALGTALARAVRRRQLLERVSARRLPARQLGVSERLGQDHRAAPPHVPAGALLHGRLVRDARRS